MKTYYKIVRKGLTSCFTTGKVQVQYKVNEYVTAPSWLPKIHRALFVFHQLVDAVNFLSTAPSADDKEIFKCKVKGVFRRLPHFLDVTTLANYKKILFCSFMTFPSGTVAVREVKLIKRLNI